MQNLEKSVSTLLNNKPVLCMLIIQSFLSFLPVLRICRAKFIIFCGRSKCMTSNATRITQSLVVLASLDTCSYHSSKKLNWFSFWLITQITKSIRSAFCTLIKQSFFKFLPIQQILRANLWSQQTFLDL